MSYSIAAAVALAALALGACARADVAPSTPAVDVVPYRLNDAPDHDRRRGDRQKKTKPVLLVQVAPLTKG
jgi:hypothetical protein